MEKIVFILDSPCDIPSTFLQGRDIRVLPVTVTYDGKECGETTLDPVSFWKYLDKSPVIPTTAMVSPQQFIECFKQCEAEGYTHAIVIPISSTGAGTFQGVTLARELYHKEQGGHMVVELVDARAYCTAYGRIAMECEPLARGGMPFEEVLAAARAMALRTEAIFSVFSLRQMKKSGRISGMAAFVGETLGFKPVLRLHNGQIAPVDKARGEKNVIPMVIEHLKKNIQDPENQILYLVHADVPEEDVDALETALRETFQPREIVRTIIGVSVTINCGPHCLGVCYLGQPRPEDG